MSKPSFAFEQELAAKGFLAICGVDEAGRGPLCGPVVAAAVVLPSIWVLSAFLPATLIGLDDSKRLTKPRRESLADAIRQEAVAVGIGLADPVEIDRLNIRCATLLAMSRAVVDLKPFSSSDCILPDYILVDGRDLPDSLPCAGDAVVKGDQRSVSIAAASIIAKTHRDAIMEQLAKQFPGYGWERNAGYPTAEHLLALKSLGVTVTHRRTFRPVAQILAESLRTEIE